MTKYQYIIMNHDYRDELHDDGLIEEVGLEVFDSEEQARAAGKQFIEENKKWTGEDQDLEIYINRIHIGGK